ncbi:ankyrin repeat protein [Echinococcus multilocularis]|uniref:Ankyrin repeat protein n=1 Tax=Echinococcus multilocularis TaxID=6211 RepID=A0A068Y3B0_ECHMU|nr:ankyrin repeat protein [Echinococcus multilocularis]
MSNSTEKQATAGPSGGDAIKITLSQAVDNNMISVAKQLLEKGADPNVHEEDPTTTPLIKATRMGYVEMMELLIENGAYPYLCDHEGDTPLHWAARNGNLAAVIVLCRCDSTTYVENMNRRTPLMEARKHGHPEIVQYLVCQDSNEEVPSADGRESRLAATSPAKRQTFGGASGGDINKFSLSQAVDDNMLSVAGRLLEKGADPNTHIEDPTTTPLIEATKRGNIEMMELLIKNGAHAYLTDHSGNTPLHWAARNGNMAAVTVLCRSNGTIDVENMCRQTPLMEAFTHGHPEIVQYLLHQN